MTRQEIFDIVEEQRASQDSMWKRDERRQVMYGFSAPHLLVLEQKVAKMREAWYTGEISRKDFISVAAIAFRALEEINDAAFLAK